jgi:hypothetical protein
MNIVYYKDSGVNKKIRFKRRDEAEAFVEWSLTYASIGDIIKFKGAVAERIEDVNGYPTWSINKKAEDWVFPVGTILRFHRKQT